MSEVVRVFLDSRALFYDWGGAVFARRDRDGGDHWSTSEEWFQLVRVVEIRGWVNCTHRRSHWRSLPSRPTEIKIGRGEWRMPFDYSITREWQEEMTPVTRLAALVRTMSLPERNIAEARELRDLYFVLLEVAADAPPGVRRA